MKILCFNITYVGFFEKTWKKYVREGYKIKAIKQLRDNKNKNKKHTDKNWLGLKEAKDIVEKYMNKKHIGIKSYYDN